ncbi:MAG: threonine ammonia-lyase [Christensenella sp.]|nr:threonine ammonia-lyase [Christensenella sp.]
METACTLEKIKEARENFPKWIVHTRLLPSSATEGTTDFFMKTENLQTTGSFKVRGAYNRMRLLTQEERKMGVIASSAGNHAQGVALAAREMRIRATIVMPKFAPLSKVNATRALGAEVVLHGEIYDDTYLFAKGIEEDTGAVFIHPYDDPAVIAGQGTVALEILEDMPDTEVILVPVGGGGLAAGVALAAKAVSSRIRIYGVEPVGAATMKAAFRENGPVSLDAVNSFADGVAVRKVGSVSYGICRKYLDGIVTVEDDQTAAAVLWMIENHKMVTEGAGALTVAAAMAGGGEWHGKKTAAVVSGGNIDARMISRIIERGLIQTGRMATFRTTVEDKPGKLARLAQAIAGCNINILSINHDRNRSQVELGEAQVELVLEANDRQHIMETRKVLEKMGYRIEEMD